MGQSGEGHGSPCVLTVKLPPPINSVCGDFLSHATETLRCLGLGRGCRSLCVPGPSGGPRAAHQVRFRVRLGEAFRERSEGSGAHTGQASGSFHVRGGAWRATHHLG